MKILWCCRCYSWNCPISLIAHTAWKVSKYRVFSGPYFPASRLKFYIPYFSRSVRYEKIYRNRWKVKCHYHFKNRSIVYWKSKPLFLRRFSVDSIMIFSSHSDISLYLQIIIVFLLSCFFKKVSWQQLLIKNSDDENRNKCYKVFKK